MPFDEIHRDDDGGGKDRHENVGHLADVIMVMINANAQANDQCEFCITKEVLFRCIAVLVYELKRDGASDAIIEPNTLGPALVSAAAEQIESVATANGGS